MESKTAPDPNDANLDDLRLRAKSQYVYVLIGAIVVAAVGIGTVVVLWSTLSVQNRLLLGAAFAFGTVILLISAADMSGNMRSYEQHNKDEERINRLYEKYRKKAGNPDDRQHESVKTSK